jgi:predicted aspartyl protease
MLVRTVVQLKRSTAAVFAIILLLNLEIGRGAVRLDALGLNLTKNGYGGAQLIRVGNFYHLPINSNGKPANLIIDTGSPATLIFRSSTKALGLTELNTNAKVSSVFGPSRDLYGTATIRALTAGNCILTNVPVAVVPAVRYSGPYGNPSGVLGLRELLRFGAILDLPHQLIYFHPPQSRFETVQTARLVRTKNGWKPVAAGGEVSQTMRSILTEQGWTPVAFSISRRHLRVPAAVNGVSCYLMVDTGAYLTMLDVDFAKRAKIGGVRTHISAQGIGKSGGDISLAVFPSLRVGSYEIKRGSATVGVLDPEAIGRGTDSEVAGLLGIEHLAMNSAIFDFVTRTMYLRPPPH